MSFRIANTLSSFPIITSSKNTFVMTIQSEQEFIMIDNNYLNWVEVTCFKDDDIKILVNNDIRYSKKIYNSDVYKKSIIIFNVNEYIIKHSILKLKSNFPLQFRLYFSNIKELENMIILNKELELTKEEYDHLFNNNNYINILEEIFD